MPGVQPTATGTLEITPLAHLLVYALDRQLDGTIVLETPDARKSAILLDSGAPAKVKTAEPVIYLGRLLLEMGFIDEPTHNRTLVEVAQKKMLHGQILVREKAIDTETLRAALREQISRQITWMFGLPGATAYGYYANVDYLQQWGGERTRVQALGLLWRAIRARADERAVQATLSSLADHPLQLHPDGQINRFNFGPEEQAVIDVLRVKPQPLGELMRAELMSDSSVERLIYALAITRHLDLRIPGAVPVGVAEAPSSSRIAIADGSAQVRRRRRLTTGSRRVQPIVPPQARPPNSAKNSDASEPEPILTPELAEFASAIQELSEKIGSMTYYDILGVPEDAPKTVIQGAFFQLAKRWHPDRLSAELGDARVVASRIFSKMSEAHQVLTDDRLRAEYTSVLKEGGASAKEQDEIQAVIRAATAFQKAEVLLKRNSMADAEEQARLAVENDASQAEYVALYTWIQAQRPGHDLPALIARLNGAVTSEPENLRARWYRGQLLKRAGDYESAIKDFRYIADRDPKHLDATRELRLYEMRRSAMRSPSQSSLNSVQPKSASKPPPRPSPRPPPDKKPGVSHKDIGNLLGKWFKR